MQTTHLGSPVTSIDTLQLTPTVSLAMQLRQAQTHIDSLTKLAFLPTGIEHRTHAPLQRDTLAKGMTPLTFRYKSEQNCVVYRYSASTLPANRHLLQQTTDTAEAFTANMLQRQDRTLMSPPLYIGDKIQALLTTLAENTDDFQILTYANIPLTLGSLRVLQNTSLHSHEAFIGSDIMDLHVVLLSEETQRLRRLHPCHYPGIRIFPSAFDIVVNIEPYNHSHIGRWTRLEDVFVNDILIWVCHVGGNHWGYIWASPRQRWMAVFDPLYKKGDAAYAAWAPKLLAIHRWMHNELHNNPLCAHSLAHMGTASRSFHNITTWTMEHPYGHQAIQTDGVNCGIIVLTAIQRIIHGLPIKFSTTGTAMKKARTRIQDQPLHMIIDSGNRWPLPPQTATLCPNSLSVYTGHNDTLTDVHANICICLHDLSDFTSYNSSRELTITFATTTRTPDHTFSPLHRCEVWTIFCIQQYTEAVQAAQSCTSSFNDIVNDQQPLRLLAWATWITNTLRDLPLDLCPPHPLLVTPDTLEQRALRAHVHHMLTQAYVQIANILLMGTPDLYTPQISPSVACRFSQLLLQTLTTIPVLVLEFRDDHCYPIKLMQGDGHQKSTCTTLPLPLTSTELSEWSTYSGIMIVFPHTTAHNVA